MASSSDPETSFLDAVILEGMKVNPEYTLNEMEAYGKGELDAEKRMCEWEAANPGSGHESSYSLTSQCIKLCLRNWTKEAEPFSDDEDARWHLIWNHLSPEVREYFQIQPTREIAMRLGLRPGVVA